LAPLYGALYHARSYRQAALLTGLQIGITHLLSSFWLAFFRDFAVFTLGASCAGTAVIGMAAGCYLYQPFSRRRPVPGSAEPRLSLPCRTVYFALVWTAYEWAKSTGFLAYPWGTLSITAVTWNTIRQVAAITGERGVSFLFALCAAVIAEGLIQGVFRPGRAGSWRVPGRLGDWARAVCFCALLFALALAYGTYELHRDVPPEKTVRSVLVQQNLDTWIIGEEESIAVSRALTEGAASECLEKTGFPPDIGVWSEGILSYTFPEGADRYDLPLEGAEESLTGFIRRMNFPLLIGGPATLDKEKRHYGNAAILFDAQGRFVKTYSKVHLVPFAEVIPFADNPVVQALMKAVAGFSYAWTPGNELVTFTIPIAGSGSGETVTFSAPICFEDAFGILCREFFRMGSELLLNLTNDSWSLTRSAEYQHFAIAVYRAIELRTTLARATNSGCTVVVDPWGRVLADLPLFEEAGLYTDIPVYPRRVTPFAAWGDWFCYLAMILALCFWLAGLRSPAHG
jgi:apolipoprotein N-acyltransferase